MRYLQDVLAQTKAQPLSGTPISNSMVENVFLIKIHASKQNERIRFYYTFDQWATTFASPTNEVEYTMWDNSNQKHVLESLSMYGIIITIQKLLMLETIAILY
jgi:N12 class adenine-specific DNA methylase